MCNFFRFSSTSTSELYFDNSIVGGGGVENFGIELLILKFCYLGCLVFLYNENLESVCHSSFHFDAGHFMLLHPNPLVTS